MRLAPVVALFALVLAPQAVAGQGYVGFGIGQASLEASPTDIDLDIEFDAEDSGYKLFGGYRFARFLAVEGSYFDMGDIDDSVLGFSFVADVKGVDACAVARMSAARWLEFYGRAGIAYWDVEATVADDDTGDRITRDDRGSGWTYGIGGALRINRHLALRVEWQVYELEQSDSVSFASLALEIGF
jgi:OOP family OmpA-OmpF porin